MTDVHTIVHIVSEQTMQNLLPILALRPRRVVQLRSEGQGFQTIAKAVVDATRAAGLDTEFSQLVADEPYPGVEAWKALTAKALQQFPNAVLNITGGTKLMSLGAFLAGQGNPVLYCDSEQQRFVSLGAPIEVPCFRETVARLTLPVVMAAHGIAAESWQFDIAQQAQLEFGQNAYALRTANPEIFDEFSKRVRPHYRPDGDIPNNKSGLAKQASIDLATLYPEGVPGPVAEFLDASAKAGYLVKQEDGGWVMPPEAHRQRSVYRLAANILDGAWFELTVLDLVHRSPAFLDPYWSVEPAGEKEKRFGETDIVALSRRNGGLHLISCKTGIRQPLEHLEAIRQRSQELGGRYGRAILALLTTDANTGHVCRQWGKVLNVKVLVNDEILDFFSANKA